MDAGCVVGAGSRHGLVTGLVEAFQLVEIERATERLVEQLDCRDYVSVAGVTRSEILKRGERLADGIALLPIHRAVAAAIVEAILRSRRSVQIEQNFEVSTSSPADSLIQDIQLSLDVRITVKRCNSPITDGNTNMVQAVPTDLVEVVLSDPSVPMIRESRICSVFAEGLRVSVLVDDSLAAGPWLKDGGGNPWLEDEPAA